MLQQLADAPVETSAIRDVHRGNLMQEGECGRNSIARGRILGERAPSIQTPHSLGGYPRTRAGV
jgi:hypothetical protein